MGGEEIRGEQGCLGWLCEDIESDVGVLRGIAG